MNTDTIVAIATAIANSGISIIRVSGSESIEIVNKIFVSPSGRSLSEFNSHTINYGHICDGNTIIDEVMVSIMKSPKSYTCEDVIEINTHGGVIVTNKVLSLLIENGARLAEPGEFTKRAFLNGRIDLSKAEAIMDVINAENNIALKSGINQLRGDIYKIITDIRNRLIHNIAYIESALDDPEHISLDGFSDTLKNEIEQILLSLTKLSASSDNGKIVKNGINTVIVGKPNAGKSSFMNYLLGEDRAIVTDIAGTTRDALEESISVRGINLHIIDTAGIRQTEDIVEKIGVDKAYKYIKNADLVLYVVDSSVELDENDYSIIKSLIGYNVIIIFNKTDLVSKIDIEYLKNVLHENGHSCDSIRFIETSSLKQTGLNDFYDCVYELFSLGKISDSNEVIITNLRHKEAIDESINSLHSVIDSINACMPEDFLSIDLMSAYSSLGRIIGEEVDDDLINTIFSQFCMGK